MFTNVGFSALYRDTIEIRNSTLPIGPLPLGNSSEFLFVHESKVELSVLESFNELGETLLVSSLLASLLIGSYFKSALYHYISDNYKELKNRPLNILILTQAVIQHLVCLLMVAVYTIGVGFDITYSEHLGEVWCNIPWYGGCFGIVYRNIGSLGMAIYRLLLIKCNYWVKEKVGQRNLLVIVLGMSLIVSILITVGFGIGNGEASRKQVTWNFCIGRAQEFREVKHNYSLLLGTVSPVSEVAPKLAVAVSLTSVMVELLCYVLFFGHLNTHDSTMLRRNVLKEEEVKRRRQKNAITFLGQFYGFVVECILYVSLMYLILNENSHINYRVGIVICFWAEFGIVSAVEVMVSENLKQYLPHRYFR